MGDRRPKQLPTYSPFQGGQGDVKAGTNTPTNSDSLHFPTFNHIRYIRFQKAYKKGKNNLYLNSPRTQRLGVSAVLDIKRL